MDYGPPILCPLSLTEVCNVVEPDPKTHFFLEKDTLGSPHACIIYILEIVLLEISSTDVKGRTYRFAVWEFE